MLAGAFNELDAALEETEPKPVLPPSQGGGSIVSVNVKHTFTVTVVGLPENEHPQPSHAQVGGEEGEIEETPVGTNVGTALGAWLGDTELLVGAKLG
eukprot:scaffold7211_cov247-Ochromonas_danica.AAC.1